MMFKMISYFWLLCLFAGCNNSSINFQSSNSFIQKTTEPIQKDITQNTIGTRFNCPEGYVRTLEADNSFAFYLRNLPLKPDGELVKHYDGSVKNNHDVYAAVIDLAIGKKDLHQCADAVMRLRAEYLFAQKKYDDIHFNFVSDGKPRYYNDYANGDFSYTKFWKYLEYIFSYANTASLSDELNAVYSIGDIEIGDVFVQKKSPFGHAVIVVDMAKDKDGNKIFMLAQSYMPAQEIQLLENPNDKNLSPWYRALAGNIQTPEWTFESSHLKRFK